jgi:hypothetical protein
VRHPKGEAPAARREVSKRDLYANFSSKHDVEALAQELAGIIERAGFRPSVLRWNAPRK